MTPAALRLAAALALAAPAAAQVAQSPSFRLDQLHVGAAGAGSCSTSFATFVEVVSAADDAALLSPAYRAEVGLLAVHDPLGGDAPVVLGVEPAHGAADADTPVTICGLHFVQGGAAGPVSVDVDGVPATGVVVVSDSRVTATVPAGPYGPADVTVTTALGSATAADAFARTPSLATSAVTVVGGAVRIRNVGPPGALFETWFSTAASVTPLPLYGTLLLGPAPLWPLLPSTAYPGPSGEAETVLPIPPEPALSGQVLHFQTVAILALAPVDVALVNAAALEIR